MRRFVLSAMIALCVGGSALAQSKTFVNGVDPTIGKTEVTLELPKDKPYVGEMIMLRMRSFVRADVVLDEIRQPPLINFDSQQLGRDNPIQAMVDGFNVAGFERDIAIFPQQSGRLIIDPFIRKVTIVTADNRRVPMEFASKAIFVDVQNHAGVGSPDAWWLPVKALTLTDKWSVPSDEIKPGALARRTLTIEAVGLTADRLPPPPTVVAPGTIVFKGPAERETVITENGPVARATYQWDIRPVSSSPAQLPAIHIPWFDIGERRVRDAAVPGLWVAYVGTLVHTSHETEKTWVQTYLSPGPIIAGLAGFGWTAAVAGFMVATKRRLQRPVRRRALRRLRRTARFHDEPGFRAALAALARDDDRLWRRISKDPRIANRLATLDRAKFGRQAGTPPPLAPLAADITLLVRTCEDTKGAAADTLPVLDAPIVFDSKASSTGSWTGSWLGSWLARLTRLVTFG